MAVRRPDGRRSLKITEAVARLPDGRALVAGGYDASIQPSAAADLIDRP